MQRPADGGSSDPVIFFDDQNAEPGARKVCGGGQPVVACACNDDIVGISLIHAVHLPSRSFTCGHATRKVYLSAQINLDLLITMRYQILHS